MLHVMVSSWWGRAGHPAQREQQRVGLEPRRFLRTESDEPRTPGLQHHREQLATVATNDAAPRRRAGCSSRAVTARPDPVPLAPRNQIPRRIRSSRALCRANRAADSAPPSRLPWRSRPAPRPARPAPLAPSMLRPPPTVSLLSPLSARAGSASVPPAVARPTARWANRVSRE